MDNRHQELILKVADGQMDNFNLIHSLERFRFRDQMYCWLIKNKIVGKEFYSFCENHNFKWPFYGKAILNEINKDNKKRSLNGKDLCHV